MLREQILSEMAQIASEQRKQLGTLSDTTMLADSGLDSLCFAVLVARLEDSVGLDPFSDTESTQFPVTLGDLFRIYERAASQDGAVPS